MFPRTTVFQKRPKKPIDMFPRTDAIKNGLQTSVPSTRPMLSAWC